MLYAIALIPAGFLADKADRPRLLAAGLALWSLLTMAASKVRLTVLHGPSASYHASAALARCPSACMHPVTMRG